MLNPSLSVIVPILNEGAGLEQFLRDLKGCLSDRVEIIVVDGGSHDDSFPLAVLCADQCLKSSRGRAVQMNRGASIAKGDVLLFLHADTRLPDQAELRIVRALSKPQEVWGYFFVRLSGCSRWFRMIAFMMNHRSRLTHMATGDQAIFVRRSVFESLGGFAAIDLMEDLSLSQKLRKICAPVCLREYVQTSSRRWEKHGILRTILTMWLLRGLYALGVSPALLARWYYGNHDDKK
jgi:rSAM/selenodomain-associated transferase 2